jgi:hypothetical protein
MCEQLVRVAIQLCHSRRRWLETHVHVRFRQAARSSERAVACALPEFASLSRRFVTAGALSTPCVMRFQGELVDIVLRNAMSLRRVSGCRPQFHPIASQTDRFFSCCL